MLAEFQEFQDSEWVVRLGQFFFIPNFVDNKHIRKPDLVFDSNVLEIGKFTSDPAAIAQHLADDWSQLWNQNNNIDWSQTVDD